MDIKYYMSYDELFSWVQLKSLANKEQQEMVSNSCSEKWGLSVAEIIKSEINFWTSEYY